MVIIEMNRRVPKSLALASKATGFPDRQNRRQARPGYTLDEITNDITGVTKASFEPTIDYVVVKIPRFAFPKVPRGRSHPDDADEIGGRSHGDWEDL